MKSFKTFENLIQSKLVMENISAAKAFMMKRLADRLRVRTVNELTDEQKADALNDAAYKAIIEMIGNDHGLAFAFVKFHFVHRASLEDLKSFYDTLKADPGLKNQLPMSIEQFANSETVNGVNSFEALNDALHKIELKRKSKWIIDELPGDIRRQVRAAGPEEQQKLLNVATILNDQGEEVKKRLLAKSRAFSDAATFIEFAENYAKGYSNSDITSKMEKIEELEPEAGILYADDRFLMLSARTEKAQKDLCSVANWCINRGSFNNASYGGGAIQINTFDFGRAATDPLHLLGTTISYEGRVTYSHDINDHSVVKSSDPAEHFRQHGYPEAMIRVLMKTLPIEAVIKKVVTNLQLDRKRPIEIFEEIVKSSYSINTEDNAAATKVIMAILLERIAPSISKDEIFDKYMKLGVLSEFSANLFNTLLGNIEPAKKQQIIEKNRETYDFLKRMAQKNSSAGNAVLQRVLASEEKVFQLLNQAANESMVMAEPKPVVAPPTTKPQTPSRPSPIPTKKPSVSPQPKAEADEVVNRFLEILADRNIDPKTFIKK